MSSETPTFDPNDLPSWAGLRAEIETDLEFMAEGYTPDEIAEIRTELKERLKKINEPSSKGKEQEHDSD